MVSCTAAHTPILLQPPGQNGDLTKNMGKMKMTSPGTKKKPPLRAKSVKKMTDDEIMTALSTYLGHSVSDQPMVCESPLRFF